MKKAMKKIVALALSSMTALSVFAASASAWYFPDDGYYWCDVCDGYHNIWYGDAHHYGYYSKVTLTAEQYPDGRIDVVVPSGATVTNYSWTGGSNVTVHEGARANSLGFARIIGPGPYSVICSVTFEYKYGYTETVRAKISGFAYCSVEQAAAKGKTTKTVTETGGYWDNDWYWTYPWYDDDYWYPSYSNRYEYTVDWSTDTYYDDGEKHVPTATVTVGKRTI